MVRILFPLCYSPELISAKVKKIKTPCYLYLSKSKKKIEIICYLSLSCLAGIALFWPETLYFVVNSLSFNRSHRSSLSLNGLLPGNLPLSPDLSRLVGGTFKCFVPPARRDRGFSAKNKK
jgi:hypothetical protein